MDAQTHSALVGLGLYSYGPWLWKLTVREIGFASMRCNDEGFWTVWFGHGGKLSDHTQVFPDAVQAAVWLKLEVATRWP